MFCDIAVAGDKTKAKSAIASDNGTRRWEERELMRHTEEPVMDLSAEDNQLVAARLPLLRCAEISRPDK